MPKQIFFPKKITDPLTGKEKIIDEKLQEEMLEKGIILTPIKKPIKENKK